MAGKIIADIIEAPFDKITLNVGNTTVVTANNSGITSSNVFTNQIIATDGWSGTNSSAGKLGGVALSFSCERSGTGTANTVMSFGNGVATGKGLRMPFAGKLVAATLSGTSVNGTVTVDVLLNGTVNSSFRMTQTNGSAGDVGVTQNWSSNPLSFTANSTIGWNQTVVPSSANGYFVSFYTIFD